MIRILLALVLLAALPAAAQQNRPRQPPQQRQAPERELTIQNRSEQTIVELYASSTEDTEWGPDKLRDSTLPVRRDFRVRFGRTRQCTFDVRVVYEDGSAEEARNHDACRQRQLAFDGSNATGGRAAGEERSFELVNRHARTIFQVFVGDEDDWGEDLLGSETLTAGGTATIQFRGECSIRLRIVFDNDAAEERRDVDVCAMTTVPVGPGWTTIENLADFTADGATAGEGFTLVNRSGKDILALYAFPDGARDHGEDLLGSDMVSDGRRFEVRMARRGQCRFTVRVVYTGADPDEERSGIDLCSATEVVVTPDWGGTASASGSDGDDAPAQGTTRIRNAGPLPIVEVYADAAGAARGPDRLGAEVVAMGGSFDLRPPDEGQCLYRVTGVFRDGREVSADADLCSGEEIVLQ